jgi:hypothetical protein
MLQPSAAMFAFVKLRRVWLQSLSLAAIFRQCF